MTKQELLYILENQQISNKHKDILKKKYYHLLNEDNKENFKNAFNRGKEIGQKARERVGTFFSGFKNSKKDRSNTQNSNNPNRKKSDRELAYDRGKQTGEMAKKGLKKSKGFFSRFINRGNIFEDFEDEDFRDKNVINNFINSAEKLIMRHAEPLRNIQTELSKSLVGVVKFLKNVKNIDNKMNRLKIFKMLMEKVKSACAAKNYNFNKFIPEEDLATCIRSFGESGESK